jgi:hypothetical protein
VVEENRGRPFRASSEERVDYEAGPPADSPSTHLRSPCAHPHLAWVLVKAASEGGEWKTSSMQTSVLFSRPHAFQRACKVTGHFIQVCHQRACFGYCIEPVSLALSASLVNKLLRRIGIPISSYAIASAQVQTLSRVLQCKDRASLCYLPEAKPLPTSLKSELPRAVRPLFPHFQTHVSRRDTSVYTCPPAPKLCKTTNASKCLG